MVCEDFFSGVREGACVLVVRCAIYLDTDSAREDKRLVRQENMRGVCRIISSEGIGDDW